ncbi:protein-L-isoaspartate(D-aspartate) O-methyltransferase [Candidatus Woesearchaeota archaeon]|nr:protein-L-isoaspartate(D-aspartate) O-methyltransferase [Candidatus Woesearchaeota archaeon]
MKHHLIEFWQTRKIITDRKLLKAFEQVDRAPFMHPHMKQDAYIDNAFPIGHGQTISQPTTVMLMTQALELKKGDKVLEVGAGSGYQAALIAKIVEPEKVITTEIIPELVEVARLNLEKAGIRNVEVIEHDGSKGYEKETPFDKIIVTAACPAIPKPLIEQLKEGGIIVAPVGSLCFGQKMIKAKKIKGRLKKTNLGMFVFVPLKGEHGYK